MDLHLHNNQNISINNPKLQSIIKKLCKIIPDIPQNIIDMLTDAFCTYCLVSISSLAICVAHYNGKKHQRKMIFYGYTPVPFDLPMKDEAIRKFDADINKNYNYVMNITATPEPLKRSMMVGAINSYLNDEGCELCGSVFTNPEMARQHFNGKKHKFKMSIKKKMFTFEGEYKCELCNVIMTCEENYLSHINGKSHLKVVEANNDKNKCIPANMVKSGVFDFFLHVDSKRYEPVKTKYLVDSHSSKKAKENNFYNVYRNCFM